MRKGCSGRSIMDSSEGLGHIYMSASLRQSRRFLILLTCFNFPGPSARSPLPQQPWESFPFDFSLICTKKAFPSTSQRVLMWRQGLNFMWRPHLNIWPAFVLPAAYRKLMIDRGPNVTEEMAFAMNVLFSLMSPRSHLYNRKCKCYAEW